MSYFIKRDRTQNDIHVALLQFKFEPEAFVLVHERKRQVRFQIYLFVELKRYNLIMLIYSFLTIY